MFGKKKTEGNPESGQEKKGFLNHKKNSADDSVSSAKKINWKFWQHEKKEEEHATFTKVDATEAEIKALKSNRLHAGIAAVAIGVLFLCMPTVFLTFVCRLIGIALIITGIICMYLYFSNQAGSFARSLLLILAGIMIVLGIWLFRNPDNIRLLIPRMLGLILFCGGISKLLSSFMLFGQRYYHWWISLILAGISIAAGSALIIMGSDVTAMFLRILGGLFVYDGIADFWVTSRIADSPEEAAAAEEERIALKAAKEAAKEAAKNEAAQEAADAEEAFHTEQGIQSAFTEADEEEPEEEIIDVEEAEEEPEEEIIDVEESGAEPEEVIPEPEAAEEEPEETVFEPESEEEPEEVIPGPETDEEEPEEVIPEPEAEGEEPKEESFEPAAEEEKTEEVFFEPGEEEQTDEEIAHAEEAAEDPGSADEKPEVKQGTNFVFSDPVESFSSETGKSEIWFHHDKPAGENEEL